MTVQRDETAAMGRRRPSWRELGWIFVTYLKDYCANCTLVGFSYIANSRLHPTERIVWLICVVLSAMGCYYLIDDYQRSFPIRAVSIVYESLPPFSNWKFPTVSVCEVVYKYDLGPEVEDYVKSLGGAVDGDYNYDVETHVSFILFPHQYHEGTIKSHCQPSEDCADCASCPETGHRELLKRFGANCSDVFIQCKLSDRVFDCCQYFLPLITPFGRCYLLNSLQNNVRGSEHWLPNILAPGTERALMNLLTHRPVQVNLLNEEDIPHTALAAVGVSVTDPGQHKTLQFNMESMENDQDVHEIVPQARNCYFPEEVLPFSVYKVYSFSTCITDCTRQFQMRMCGCTPYMMNPFADPRYPDCDLAGLNCLESHFMVKPDAKLMLGKKDGKTKCECLPSCNEGDIRAIYESVSDFNPSSTARNVTLSMTALPTDQYRRQALRTRLDVVVSVGGMLGLFLGASILSGIEFIHYFTVRAMSNAVRARQERV
ncbi:sodium channel protein Nach [Drosophila guanche]|uniref:Blast:Sodium channel protein Nach n=1 Tax=Drosophila guanche TaxID=7266 RepID=A0A3B0KC49_DROGU|nr:sodium channel protein Nach [Drosophila guanche]SPP83286.1 blast:Sodium channel protein Nach [Drosophila guanche]